MVKTNVCTYDIEEGKYLPTEIETPKPVMTVKTLIKELEAFIEQYPQYEDLPVMILDMEDPDVLEPYTGLVTDVELDSFSEEQGLVCNILSWPSKKEPK